MRQPVSLRTMRGMRTARLLRASKNKYFPTKALTAIVKPSKKFVAMVDKVIDKRADVKQGPVLEPTGSDYNECFLINSSTAIGSRTFGLYPIGEQPVALANGSNRITANQARITSAKLRLNFRAYFASPHASTTAGTAQRDLVPNRPVLVRWAIVRKSHKNVNNPIDDQSNLWRQLFLYPPVPMDPGFAGAAAEMIYHEDHFRNWSPARYRSVWRQNTNTEARLSVLKSGKMIIRPQPASSDPSTEVFTSAGANMMKSSSMFFPNSSQEGIYLAVAPGTERHVGTNVDYGSIESSIDIDTTSLFPNGGLCEWAQNHNPNSGAVDGPNPAHYPVFVCMIEPQSWTAATMPTWPHPDYFRVCVRGAEVYEWTD